MADRILYAYAVTPPGLDPAGAPSGIDGASVRLVVESELAALVSSVDKSVYAPDRVEVLTEEVGWVAPRASAHDAVVTWAGDRGPVIPLPIFTLFHDESRVRAILGDLAA